MSNCLLIFFLWCFMLISTVTTTPKICSVHFGVCVSAGCCLSERYRNGIAFQVLSFWRHTERAKNSWYMEWSGPLSSVSCHDVRLSLSLNDRNKKKKPFSSSDTNKFSPNFQLKRGEKTFVYRLFNGKMALILPDLRLILSNCFPLDSVQF